MADDNKSLAKTAEILEAIVALDNNEFNALLRALELGMWDEWDCDLPTGLTMFGVDEVRIAVKAAAGFVRGAENASSN